jgi:hypothetical protein
MKNSAGPGAAAYRTKSFFLSCALYRDDPGFYRGLFILAQRDYICKLSTIISQL